MTADLHQLLCDAFERKDEIHVAGSDGAAWRTLATSPISGFGSCAKVIPRSAFIASSSSMPSEAVHERSRRWRGGSGPRQHVQEILYRAMPPLLAWQQALIRRPLGSLKLC
jgi:hypothetical protein